jgi:hypothetical protein
MTNYSDFKSDVVNTAKRNTGISAGVGGNTIYVQTIHDLPVPASNGDRAFVASNNYYYLYFNGWRSTGAAVNESPTSITGNNANYTIDVSNNEVITLSSTDPEGFPLTWSYSVTTGSISGVASVSQNVNVFTVTGIGGGTFTLTFSASDGINTATTTSDFTIEAAGPETFVLPPFAIGAMANYTYTINISTTQADVLLEYGKNTNSVANVTGASSMDLYNLNAGATNNGYTPVGTYTTASAADSYRTGDNAYYSAARSTTNYTDAFYLARNRASGTNYADFMFWVKLTADPASYPDGIILHTENEQFLSYSSDGYWVIGWTGANGGGLTNGATITWRKTNITCVEDEWNFFTFKDTAQSSTFYHGKLSSSNPTSYSMTSGTTYTHTYGTTLNTADFANTSNSFVVGAYIGSAFL